MFRLIALLAVGGALLAQTGEDVLLVVNRSSALSREIGEYYARKRAVPSRNICRIRTTTNEEITRTVYEQEIARPVAEFLKSRNLQGKILYIVTTLGVPLKVAGTSGGRRSDAASVDSELTLLYEAVQGASHALDGPVSNPFYRQRDEPFRHPRFPIYLVTRLAGYDVGDVKAMIDRSLAARNSGAFVLDLNSKDDGPGNNWLRTAAMLLPGDRVLLEESAEVVYSARSVIGYASWGSNDAARKRRRLGFEWLPGAIATEYVSTNGRTFRRPPEDWTYSTWRDKERFFAGSPQGLTADLIHEGATGASGHVYEPYLSFTPRPDLLFPAYYSGRTLAESFYLAIPGLSWMNIVIGDPLCRLGRPE